MNDSENVGNSNILKAPTTGGVASIGTDEYSDLQAAITAAQPGDIVTLLQDIDYDEGATIHIEKEVTLDLNGKTITAKAIHDEDLAGYFPPSPFWKSFIHIESGGKLTITDNDSNGSITVNGDPQAKFEFVYAVVVDIGGAFELNNATITSNSNGRSCPIYALGPVTVNGGTLSITGKGSTTIDDHTNYEVRLNSGTFTGSVESYWLGEGAYAQYDGAQTTVSDVQPSEYAARLQSRDRIYYIGVDGANAALADADVASGDTLTLNNVTPTGQKKFRRLEPGVNDTLTVKLEGSAAFDAETNLIPEDDYGYNVQGTTGEDPRTTTYSLVVDKDNAAARIGEAYYATLRDASVAAKPGDTITILRDVDVVADGRQSGSYYDTGWSIWKTSTLDLNGYTLSGALTTQDSWAYAVLYTTSLDEDPITLTILDSSPGQTGRIQNTSTAKLGNYAISATQNTIIKVCSGNFFGSKSTTGSAATRGAVDTPSKYEEKPGQVEITGGTFDMDVSKYIDPKCSRVQNNNDGTYTVLPIDIPEPTDADLANGLVTVKCLNRVACSDMQYGLNAAVAHNKYTMVQVSATEYSVTYDADAFAVNGHSLYSADTLTWTLTYEDGKWNLAPQTPGVDDVVLVTHAPTTLDEVTKFIDGRTDVIKTSCVNGTTGACAYGLMLAFVNPDHVVSVVQEKNSSGEPIRGSYIATLKMDQFAAACAKACNNKSFADSPRAHDVQSQNPVQWRFQVRQAEVSTDTGAEKQYVWSAEPVEAGKDDVCQVAHRVVLTFSYDQHGVMVDDTKVEYKYNTTEITDGTVPTPTREGYTFVRWLDADGNEFVPTAPVTEDHTYDTIEWTPIKYRVIFDANAGGKNVTGTMGDQVFTYDQQQTLNPNQFVCTNSVFDDRLKQDTQLYEFGGWNTEADGSGTPYADEADFTNKSVKHGERITLYAQWKHVTKTLAYVSAQGPAPDVADVDIFTEVTVADAPANVEGYTFVGWRSDIDGLRETFKPGDKFVMPNTDVTLTAVWEEIVPDATYTVSTSVNGTMEQIAEGLKAGETYTINIDDPVKEGYRFTGWQVSPTGAVLKKGDTFNMPAGNVILTAQFQKIEKFTVTYQYDGVTAVGDTYEVGSVVTVMRNDPALNGSTFLYWRSSHEGQQLKKGDTFIMPNTNVVLTAVGQKNPTKYMVQFLVDGSLIGQKTGIAGSFITLKPAQTKNGFTFVGWQSSVGEGKIYPANSRFEIPATTVKMTAVWQADPATYTVTYALNGGEGSASDSNAYVESAFVTVTDAAVTKAGFIFAGWRSSYGGAVYQANDTFQMPGTNVTLTAQWQPEEATYTVSTSVNGTLTQIANGKKANEVYTIAVDDPTLDGHTFTGWLLSSTGTIVNKGDTFNMPAGDVVLTAQFEKVETRTVTYQYGNVTSAAESFEVGSTVTVTRNNPTQNGKTFLYWRSSYEGKQLQKGDTFTMPNADVVLTAVWQENPTEYTVQFYVDGSLIGQEKGVAGSYVTLKPAPQAKDGYTFIGWQSSVGEGTVYPANSRFEVPATNVKMNAVWEKNSYTVTWKNDDGTILAKDTVEAGSTPEYVGAKPTKEATAETSYTFVGWDPEVAPVTEDVTYTAQFEGTVRTYTVKFYNADGTLLESKQVKYGVIPKLGREPKKEGDAQYSYKFKAWSPKLAPVTDDAEYYATYTKTINTYTVTWVIDGTSETQTYEYGKMPAHADPVKIATDDAVYTFEGWTPALSIVTGNVTYTAQFTETAKHTVSYNLNGGTPAFASAKYAEGEVVNTPADVPTKTGYVFTGWLISFENKTVNANGTFSMPNTDVTLTAQWRVAITGNVYIPAIDPVHGVHEQPYNAQFTAKKDNATGDPVAAGDVQFVLVDEDGHADTTRNIGHGLTLNVDGSITGTAMGAGEVPFRVKLANADGDFVSDEIFAFTIVIEKAPRTCTVTIADWTYGDKASEPVVTLSKTEVPETYTYYYKVKGAPDDTYTTTVPVDAGEYTLKAVVAETANYLSREATANFKILKKLIVSVDPAVTAPKACQMPQTTVTAEGYTGVITWAPADDTFKYSTVYTATVVLTPDSNHRFADSTTAENGWTKEAYDSAAGTLKLTKTFPKTAQDTVKTPVIKPNGGNFYGSQRVTITCATEGATIYYTTDGSTPTQSSKQYTEAFSITDDTTVKAIAVKANYNDSAVAEAEFTKRTGGGGGGTVVTPVKPSKKDNSLKFNTAEHFAYVNGYPDGTVKPTGDVTRAEVAAILYRVIDADCVKTYETTRCSFSDVVRGDWFNTYVATLENAGVIVDTRTNGKFRPNEAITRAELAAMLAQFADIKSAANSFNDVSARHWASDEIAVCAKMGWINGYPDGSFRPDATITRAEMMAMINRALDRTPKSVSDLLSGMKTWSDNANTGAWYYLDVQEATNSHTYMKSGTHETWKKLH